MNWGHQFTLHVIDYYLHNALQAYYKMPEIPKPDEIWITWNDFDIETEQREGWTYQ